MSDGASTRCRRSGWRWRLSTTLLMMYMIVVDQLSVTDCLSTRRAEHSVGSRRRAGYRPADDRSSYLDLPAEDSRRGVPPPKHRQTLLDQLVRHLRNAPARESLDQRTHDTPRGDEQCLFYNLWGILAGTRKFKNWSILFTVSKTNVSLAKHLFLVSFA